MLWTESTIQCRNLHLSDWLNPHSLLRQCTLAPILPRNYKNARCLLIIIGFKLWKVKGFELTRSKQCRETISNHYFILYLLFWFVWIICLIRLDPNPLLRQYTLAPILSRKYKDARCPLINFWYIIICLFDLGSACFGWSQQSNAVICTCFTTYRQCCLVLYYYEIKI